MGPRTETHVLSTFCSHCSFLGRLSVAAVIKVPIWRDVTCFSGYKISLQFKPKFGLFKHESVTLLLCKPALTPMQAHYGQFRQAIRLETSPAIISSFICSLNHFTFPFHGTYTTVSETEPNALETSKGEGAALKFPSMANLSCIARALAAQHGLDHLSEGIKSLLAILSHSSQPQPLQLQTAAEKNSPLCLPFTKLACVLVAVAV